jgi:DNA-binding NarL/FixJ family response regulator
MTVSVSHGKPTVSAGIRSILSRSPDHSIAVVSAGTAHHDPSAIVITDYEGGLAAARERYCRRDERPRVIVVTDRIREWELRTALDSGIDGILTENCDSGELIEALDCIRRGVPYLSASIAERAKASLRRQKLTDRERQVLELVGKGLCNKSIAKGLGIAEVTAKIHLQHMMGKLGAHSRTQAVVIGNSLGLLDLQC